MTCLITGATGFVGSRLTAFLCSQGHTIHTHGFDITKPIPPIPNIDVVFHTAAIARTPQAIADPMRCHEVNVTGALNIFRAFPNARIVHSSSNVVYASPNPYQASKLAADYYAMAFNQTYGARIICLRYSNIIGPGMNIGDPAVLPVFRDSRDSRGYVEVMGDGTQTRQFTYIDDIVEANLVAALSDHCGIMDITTGINTSMNEFAEHFGCPVHHIDGRSGDRKDVPQSTVVAETYLGWRAKIPFDDGMRRSLA